MPSFPKESRLRTSHQFNEVNRRGKKVQGKYLLISYLDAQEGPSRLGITVTKKYGKAYKRNRFKRVVREAFRLSQQDLPPHLQLNVRPKLHADIVQEISTQKVQEELLQLLNERGTFACSTSSTDSRNDK